MTRRRKPWYRRLRPFFVQWSVGDYALPHEFVREFYICCGLFEARWVWLDHDFAPAMRLRLRFIHWGPERR